MITLIEAIAAVVLLHPLWNLQLDIAEMLLQTMEHFTRNETAYVTSGGQHLALGEATVRHLVEKIKLKDNAIAAVECIFGNLRN